ncbi:MAG: hypothetical protein HQK60_10480 [Deltaproteobacteria bacterium]|nr:hypothetical protein [Deltaproteobacteria bacterium]
MTTLAEQEKAYFLGREFLTWLWYQSEQRGGSVFIPEMGDLDLTFERRALMESGEGDFTETVLCRGLNSELKEARLALREGKKVKEVRIRLSQDTKEWSFTIKGDSLDFQSVNLPKGGPVDTDDEEAEFFLRVGYLTELFQIIDHLYGDFIHQRLDPAWPEKGLAEIRLWVSKPE